MDYPMTDYSAWIAVGLFVIAAALWKPLERERSRVRTAFGLLILWAGFVFFTSFVSRFHVDTQIAREVSRTLLILAVVQISFLIVFDILLRKIRLPRFASEIVIVVAYAAALLQLLKRLGVDATG